MDKEKKLIEFLKENKAKGIKEIVDNLQWNKKNKEESRSFLLRLEEEGKIIKVKGEKYTLPEKSGLLKGNFELVKNRFAFVDTDTEGIFIPRGKYRNAMSGDTVFIRLIKEGNDGRKKEGEVVKVVKREKNRIIGIYEQSRNFGFVKPRENFGKDIYISKKNAMGSRDGELVLVEITFWGSSDKKPEGKVLEILGDPFDTDVMITALIKRENYSETFAHPVKNELTNIKEITDEEIKNRVDLRNIDIITIDGADAKDLDDGVYVKKLKNGNHKLIVAIADVSYYVPEGSELDKEARTRGNSVYLVDRVIPMLPREISNGICSLNEGVDRLAFVVEAEIDDKGKIFNEETYKAIIKVKHRMTYSNVNKILSGDKEIVDRYKDIYNMILEMFELSKIIREKRFKRGSIDFDLPDIKVVLDERKRVEYIKLRDRGEAEKLIEDFMICANEIIAEKIFWIEIPSVYRTHDQPDIERIKQLNEFLVKFNYRIGGAEELHPGKFQKIIEDSKGDVNQMLIHKMILMSLKQAKYTVNNTGHFGLASSYYTHFTSPIRRYSDLLVHRILFSIISNKINRKKLPKMEMELIETTNHISKTERRAMKAEDESIKIKVTEFMIDKIGEVFKGKITGLNKSGMFVELENHVDAFFSTRFAKGNYFFDEKKYKILEKNSNKEYNIGNFFEFLVARVSLEDLTIEVVPYEAE